MLVSEIIVSYVCDMKFYNREKEIKKLLEIKEQSKKNAQFSVVTGRRRIGKTQLLLKSYENTKFLYFFVAKKSEVILCQDFLQELKEKLNPPILGEVNSFSVLFEYIVQLSYEQNITLIIDEFQEFFTVNPSVYSDMQRIWDLHKDKAKLNLIVSGSVISLMYKIFENYKEVHLFWKQYENKAEPVFKASYDAFLKANKQKEGINSYDLVVGLLIPHYRS